jgi:hypothetical protein
MNLAASPGDSSAFLKNKFWIAVFRFIHLNTGSSAAADELSSPQYARRWNFCVILAG